MTGVGGCGWRGMGSSRGGGMGVGGGNGEAGGMRG